MARCSFVVIALPTSLLILLLHIKPTTATGKGTILLRSTDTESKGEIGCSTSGAKDSMFITDIKLRASSGSEAPTTTTNNFRSSDESLRNVFGKVQIDLVAPNRQLMKLMSAISTKTRVMFLKDYDFYFTTLDIGSTSRPMLYSYLGLQFATKEQLKSWYEPFKGRFQESLLISCRSLANIKRKSIEELNDKEKELLIEIVREARSGGNESKFKMAYALFQYNMNLFMLENYLDLCLKLENEELSNEFSDLNLII